MLAMDLTLLISSFNNPAVTAGSLFFQNYEVLALIILFGVAMFLTNKRLALVIALGLALLFVPLLKDAYAQPRPCENLKTLQCETDYGMPSAHATVAFIFIAAAVGTWAFLFFLPVGLFMAFSRIYLGLHSFEQVAAGAALGVILFLVADAIAKRLAPWLKKKVRFA